MKKILLITDLFTPYSTSSSTQMMIYSLLEGLFKMNIDLFVFGVFDSKSDQEKISEYLINKHIKYILHKTRIDSRCNAPKKNFFLWQRETILPSFVTKGLSRIDFEPDIILTTIPSFETGIISIFYKNKFYNKAELRAMWTDVIAYNGLNNTKEISLKRKIFKNLEINILKKFERNYFLGKSQMQFMMKAYKKYSSKMDYYHASFFPFANYYKDRKNDNTLLYFGNLSKEYRDFSKILQFANTNSKVRLIIIGDAGSDFAIESTNIEYRLLKNRISTAEEMSQIESTGNISICFLNRKGFSLPGKMFYLAHFNRPIIIVKDGAFKNDIEQEFQEYDRFIFCENTVSDLNMAFEKATMSINNNETFDDKATQFLPENRFAKLLD